MIKLGDDYYTVVVYPAPKKVTNEWNNFRGIDWPSMIRGAFKTELQAIEWVIANLLHGAPFTVRKVEYEAD